MLDVCCGMGGVSKGFALEGFSVTGIDIEDAPNKLGYKFPFIQADIRSLNGKNFRGYDVIWGSTPCRNFTQLPDHAYRADGENWKWKNPKDPQAGLELVNAFLQFVNDAAPKYWILENVVGLANYLDLTPRAYNSRILNGKRHVFYGNYPLFLMPRSVRPKRAIDYGGPLRSWYRAEIPLPCSRAFARACREALEPQLLICNLSAKSEVSKC
jgi:hypothetical protein